MLLIFLLTFSFLFSLDALGKQKGDEWGNRIKNLYKGRVQDYLMKPLTQERGKVVNPAGKTFDINSPFCGKGEIKNKRVILRVTVQGSSIYISFSSDGKTLDRSYSFSGLWHCAKGYCPSSRDSCVKLDIRGGNLYTSNAGRLDGCARSDIYPQPPTLIGSYLIDRLIEDYKSRGIKVNYSDLAVRGNTAYYYGGEIECQDKKERVVNIGDNPYEMTDKALTYYFACDPDKDVTCRILRRLDNNAYSNVSSGSLQTCVIERKFPPPSASRSDKRVCVPGTKVYAYGYSETNPYCYQNPGDKWHSYVSSFWLECKPDGSGYILKGWGYWEGAPCGGAKRFPPEPQIVWNYQMNTNYDWLELGRLSVNRRRGGEDIIELDKVSEEEKKCVSDEPTPYKVWVKNTHYENQYNILEIKVDNAPACNYFKFKVQGLGPEQIVNGCEQYEKESCVLWNEWWEDANRKRIQILKEGQPTEIASRCEALQWDNNLKQWVSSYDTNQTPPENCVGIPKTCKEVRPGIIECREWWKKIRQYKCTNTHDINPDLTLAERAMNSAVYDTETGEISFSMKESSTDCVKPGECNSVLKEITVYLCSATSKEFEGIKLCQDNCYRTVACREEVYSWICAVDGKEYASEEACSNNCSEPGTCKTKYVCPFNNTGYDSKSACVSNCNNCEREGSCNPFVRYVCSIDNREYDSSDTCRRNCQRNGTCNQEYYCSSGTLQGNLCVVYPQCPGGSYNPSTGRCEATPTCPYPGWYSGGYCVANPKRVCKPYAFSCSFYHPSVGSIYAGGYCSGSNCYASNWGYNGWAYYSVYCAYYGGGYPYFYASVYYSNPYVWASSTAYDNNRSCSSSSRYFYIYTAYGSVRVYASVYKRYYWECPYPYTRYGSVCRTNPSCPSGYTFNRSRGVCERPPSCPSGYSWNGRYCVKPAQIRYRCSATGRVYGNLNACRSECILNGNCREKRKWRCSLNGNLYDNEASCRVSCREQIPDCCNAMGYCVENGRYYSLDGCSEYCRTPAQCSPRYRYTCPKTGNVYYDKGTCESECREKAPCSARRKTVTRYVCSLTYEEYESFEACKKVCDTRYNCLTGKYKTSAWATDLKNCHNPSCIVKVPGSGRPRHDFKIVECVKTGDSWSCPASGGTVVEGCSCELRSGFAIPLGIWGVLYEALNDRTCD